VGGGVEARKETKGGKDFVRVSIRKHGTKKGLLGKENLLQEDS